MVVGADLIFPQFVVDYKNWIQQGIQSFGENLTNWRFLCHCCQKSYPCESQDKTQLIEEATKCKNCGTTSISGLYSLQKVKVDHQIISVFSFATNN